MRVLVPPYPRKNLVRSVVLILAILIAYSGISLWLICVSLMINDIEHPFMILFEMHVSSLVECLSKSFAHFLFP